MRFGLESKKGSRGLGRERAYFVKLLLSLKYLTVLIIKWGGYHLIFKSEIICHFVVICYINTCLLKFQ